MQICGGYNENNNDTILILHQLFGHYQKINPSLNILKRDLSFSKSIIF